MWKLSTFPKKMRKGNERKDTIKSHQPCGLGWSSVVCMSVFNPSSLTLRVSTLWGWIHPSPTPFPERSIPPRRSRSLTLARDNKNMLRHLCHWVPFAEKQAGSSPFVAPAPMGQGEKNIPWCASQGWCGPSVPLRDYSSQSTDEWCRN